MPYYDYRCPHCGPFDCRRPLSESSLPGICPKCGSESPRMLSAPHVAGSAASSDFSGPSGGGCGSGSCGHMH